MNKCEWKQHLLYQTGSEGRNQRWEVIVLGRDTKPQIAPECVFICVWVYRSQNTVTTVHGRIHEFENLAELEMLPEQEHVLWKGVCFDTEKGKKCRVELNLETKLNRFALKPHLKKEFDEKIMNEDVSVEVGPFRSTGQKVQFCTLRC